MEGCIQNPGAGGGQRQVINTANSVLYQQIDIVK